MNVSDLPLRTTQSHIVIVIAIVGNHTHNQYHIYHYTQLSRSDTSFFFILSSAIVHRPSSPVPRPPSPIIHHGHQHNKPLHEAPSPSSNPSLSRIPAHTASSLVNIASSPSLHSLILSSTAAAAPPRRSHHHRLPPCRRPRVAHAGL